MCRRTRASAPPISTPAGSWPTSSIGIGARKDSLVEYFRLAALADEDLFEERAGIAGLTFVAAAGGTARAPVHRYRFPPQEIELRGGEPLHQRGGAKFGSVERISLEERTIDIKKRKDTASIHPEAVFSHNLIGTTVLAEALARIGEHVVDQGITGKGTYGAARSLLLREQPQLGGEPLRLPDETAVATATRIAPSFKGVSYRFRDRQAQGRRTLAPA